MYRCAPHFDGAFHWQEAGWGAGREVVVLLHGILAHGMAWRHVADLLSQHFWVVVVDMPGHGRDRSFTHAGMEPRVDAHDEWLRALIGQVTKHSGRERVHVVGHSLGGIVAFSAMRHPHGALHQIASIGLISPGLSVRTLPRSLTKLLPLVPAGLVRRSLTPPSLRLFEPLQWRSGERMTRRELRRYLAPAKDPERFAFIYELMCDVARQPDRLAGARKIAIPALIIYGAKDWLVPVRAVHHLRREIPEATLEILERCGHCPMEEHPLVVARQLNRFLRPDLGALAS